MRGLGSSDVVKQLPPPGTGGGGLGSLGGWPGGPVALPTTCQGPPSPVVGGGIGLLGLRWVSSAVEEGRSAQKDQVVGCRP